MRKKVFCVLVMVSAMVMAALACANYGTGWTLPFLHPSSPWVAVRADSGKAIALQAHNGSTGWSGGSEIRQVPRLVLFQHHQLTDPERRTLHIQLNGLQIPSSGVTVTLRVETQSGDPELSGVQESRIPVWEASTWMDSDEAVHATGSSLTFSHTFTERVTISADRQIRTPSGYYRYQITVKDRGDATTLYEFQQDYAFLVENQHTSEQLAGLGFDWVARIDDCADHGCSASLS